jgi:adenosylcobinamide-GDP ribazoletransferase
MTSPARETEELHEAAEHTVEPSSGRVSPWISMVAALQFLTIVPPLVRRLFSNAELGNSVACFPLVGLLLGCGLAVLDLALRIMLPTEVATALVLAVWVVATGGLHIDGFLDSCDALLGGRTPEERLRILRDERVGAFAVAGGILLMLLKFAALASLHQSAGAIVLACVLGRWMITLAMLLFPYGWPSGLGRVMKDHAGPRQGVIATLFTLAAVVAIAPAWGAIAVLATLAVSALTVRFSLRRLPGLTGDIYGAVCELSEAAVLVVWAGCEKNLL